MKRIQTILLSMILLGFTACDKDSEPTNFAPTLSTGNATDIYRVGATLSGSISKGENTVVKEYGILLSELRSMAEYSELKVTDGATTYSIDVQNLQPGKTYYYCAYAYSGYSHARGEVKEFATTESNAPVFGAATVSAVGEGEARLSCHILDEGGSVLALSGFCYKESAAGGEPTANDAVVNVTPTGGAMNVTLTGLLPSTEYRVRAYAVNSSGVGYSESITFTTKATTKTPPVVSSATVGEVTATTAVAVASVIADGGCAILSKGFCWSSQAAVPTVEHTKQTVETDGATFSTTLTGLEPNTRYYLCAYVENEMGMAYSEPVEFTTEKQIDLAVLSAITVKEVLPTAFTVEATVTDNGGGTVSECGFCYVVGQGLPTVNDAKLTATVGTTFSATATGLTPQTVYIIRAYVVNEKGIAYSEPMVLTTKKPDPQEGDAVYPEV